MSKRRLATGILALLGMNGMMLATAPSARADDYTHYWSTKVTKVEAWETADFIQLCDITSTISVTSKINVWYWSKSQQKWIKRYGLSVYGKGNCTHRSVDNGGVYNLPENHTIKIGISGASGWAYHTYYNDH